MANTNIMLGFPNRIDKTTLSGGLWTSELPLTNLQTRELAQVARTVDVDETSTQFVIDFGQPRKVDLLSFINHNASFSGMVVIESSKTNDFATIEDTYTADMWSGISDSAWSVQESEWEDDSFWLGGYTEEEVQGFTSVSTNIIDYFEATRFLRVRIIDPQNQDGFIEIGRVFVGPVIQPQINYSFGAGLSYETNTAIEEALGGAEYFDEREPFRVFRFSLEMMTDGDAYGKFLEIIRRAGVHGEIFVVPDPEDKFQGLRRNFMGRNRQLNPLEQTMYADGGTRNSMAFEIKELR